LQPQYQQSVDNLIISLSSPAVVEGSSPLKQPAQAARKASACYPPGKSALKKEKDA
jgi:hypothetical protein